MILMDFDKAGAEWVVVAYLCGDSRMLDVIKNKKSPHVVTGSVMTGASEELVQRENKLVDKATNPAELERLRKPILDELNAQCTFIPRTMSIRQAGKKANHGLNYREKYRMFALINEIEEKEAKIIVSSYSTKVYPGIQTYWDWIDETMRTNRTMVNCFGRKIRLLDAWGDQLKKAATAALPQSTVVDMVNEGMVKFYNDTSPETARAELLTQTHDSITFQHPLDDWNLLGAFSAKVALDFMSPEVEYNHRKFKIDTDLKIGFDWGNMVEVAVTNDIEANAEAIRIGVEKLRSAS